MPSVLSPSKSFPCRSPNLDGPWHPDLPLHGSPNRLTPLQQDCGPHFLVLRHPRLMAFTLAPSLLSMFPDARRLSHSVLLKITFFCDLPWPPHLKLQGPTQNSLYPSLLGFPSSNYQQLAKYKYHQILRILYFPQLDCESHEGRESRLFYSPPPPTSQAHNNTYY